MKATKRKRSDRAVRLSVSFKPADYADLEAIAREKSVSVAWVVRQAVSAYLSARAPLFRPTTEPNE
jgi:allophanate hydrolase subunit 1